MEKTNYVLIENTKVHLTKVFTSISAIRKIFKSYVDSEIQLEEELWKLLKVDYKNEFDTYISFKAKNWYTFNFRVLKIIINKY